MLKSTQNETKPMARRQTQCPDFAEIIKDTTPDHSLFEQIATCFAGRLESFAKYYCKDPNLGKDAFQDAMVSAMRYLETYRGDSPIESWLRRIVVSACSRLRRGKKNSPAVNLPLDASPVAATVEGDMTADQELRVMVSQQLKLVQDEIDKLKEPNRTMLMLHDVEEVSIADLTKRFQMTEESVKSRLKRSRAVVRQNLLALMQ
jgi:RNA polymerase sigma-70 factor (ECF subfamily)